MCYLELLIPILLLGVISGISGIMFDSLMDFGQIFQKVRINKVKKAAKKLNRISVFEKSLEEIYEGDPSRRVELADKLYWSFVTSQTSSLTLWLCSKCLAMRIGLSLGALNGVSTFDLVLLIDSGYNLITLGTLIFHSLLKVYGVILVSFISERLLNR